MALTKEDRIKLRNALLYIADCMIAVNDMEQMHNCNDCGIRKRCTYLPEVGTPVRWNCPLWEDTAPTVDAIPVDWLVQMRDLRRAAVAAHPDISEGSMEMLRGISMVLELWEDEKEAR